MKRLLLLSALLAALPVSGCCGLPAFEPGVGFYWNREAGREWVRHVDWGDFIVETAFSFIDNLIDPKTEEEEMDEFFSN
jgi:hypothetical protein